MLAGQRVSVLDNVVSGSSNLDQVLLDLHRVQASQSTLPILAQLCLSGGTTCEIRLMLATLCVCKVGAIVLVDCQTETALEAADVVLENVGIFVEIYRLERKLAETFAAVCIRGRL